MNDLKNDSTSVTFLELLFKIYQKDMTTLVIVNTFQKSKDTAKHKTWILIQTRLLMLKGTSSNYEIIRINIKHNKFY